MNTLTGPIGGSGPAEAAFMRGKAGSRGSGVRQSIQALQLPIAHEVTLGAGRRGAFVLARHRGSPNLLADYSR